MAVTAKAQVTRKEPSGDGATVTFGADYQDGRNKEWAEATPLFSLTMKLKGGVADQFEQGGKYTITFEPTGD